MNFRRFLTVSLSTILATVTAANTTLDCSPEAIPRPELLQTHILDFQATKVHNFTLTTLEPGSNQADRATIDFCNVTITYTHPGWNDTINTHVWLPLEGWNGNFHGTGGGGWSTGAGAIYMTYAVAQGYAAVFTDGGHPISLEVTASASSWAQVSPGNVNYYLLTDFATVTLNEMTLMGKSITQSYYNIAPKYSYFAGCSGGGRQGLMLAQTYPEAYDGIIAVAPAINWAQFVVSGYWAQHTMNKLRVYPSSCEIDAYTAAAIAACDSLDGLEDGIISHSGVCKFNPYSMIGKNYTSCDGTETQYTAAGAIVVEAAWDGPWGTANNGQGWYGLNKDAAISTYHAAPATCASNGTCSATPNNLFLDWIQLFVIKDPAYEVTKMTDGDFFSVLHSSVNEYNSLISASDPDLSRFRNSGGKMISWHGLVDEIIPPNGTIEYYDRVLELDPNAADYFRFFEAPGVAHCAGGPGAFPQDVLQDIVAWVEQGVAPETLKAIDSAGESRELCSYPSVQTYVAGNERQSSSFKCV
jgi:pimeloyl-ACP methyl ester carboxylesterase